MKRSWFLNKWMYGMYMILLAITIVIVYNSYKPLPEGISFEGRAHRVDDVNFIYDLSYKDKSGHTQHEQRIFNDIYQAIEDADEFIVISRDSGRMKMGCIRLIIKNIRMNFLCLSILLTVYRSFSNLQPTNFPLIRKFRF
ncbi:hypothetical protein [Peribacillus loiseleuriae]|uniref:Uncharacterized protein n=1 Tax=Peribacillus loiseleuriae TaxID=1679170 RepID=A0A0K9GZE2_9BACI|nr:hypothetical protein [Peribacillus loiseleuriae]KMY52008.1 hypothetical protein AC625_22805 [Peribacillus loiseleuriae]